MISGVQGCGSFLFSVCACRSYLVSAISVYHTRHSVPAFMFESVCARVRAPGSHTVRRLVVVAHVVFQYRIAFILCGCSVHAHCRIQILIVSVRNIPCVYLLLNRSKSTLLCSHTK